MNEIYDLLFYKFEFEKVRNEIFDKFSSEIEAFIFEHKYNDLKDFLSKFIEYKKFKSDITYFKFKFNNMGNILYFFHEDYKEYIYTITNLKKFKISLCADGSNAKDEWIFNDDYLMYLISKIYKMKNPKFAHTIESIKDESSIISLKEENLKDFMKSDWNTIYEANESINFDKILEKKKIFFNDKINDDFFIQLLGLNGINHLPNDFLAYKDYCSSFENIFSSHNLSNKKVIIFHNEDIYFRFNLFQQLEIKYKWGVFGNFYINFDLLRNSKRHERLERIAYFLSFLFPNDYPKFSTFFEEKIKYKISDNLDCWKEIIDEIINYFQNNIFNKKKEAEKSENIESSNKIKSLYDNIQLFNNVEKKNLLLFLIIFQMKKKRKLLKILLMNVLIQILFILLFIL